MKRHAFTLVELLVALLIMVILTTLVLAAFQRDDGDRLSATSRKIQAVLEGARSHAIATKQPRGVRLVPSPTDPWVIDRLMPIGAVEQLDDTGTLTRAELTPGNWRWILTADNPGLIARLAPPSIVPTGRNLIRVGNRVEIPAGTGNWYTLSADNFRPDLGELSIAGEYQPSQLVAGNYAAVPAAVAFRMETSAASLANVETVQFERGIVIDRWASRLPASLEIMYDARGGLDGSLAAGGLIHLYVTTLADVELTRNLVSPNHPADGGTLTAPIVPANAPNVPRVTPYLVTIYTQTGQVVTSPVDLTDADSDLLADQPYRQAQRGKEAN